MGGVGIAIAIRRREGGRFYGFVLYWILGRRIRKVRGELYEK